ncbi:alpha/beta fold hydrolase [Sinisalibacter aestuarii]|uniref:Hydrolase n=1 Tax=Sinisalibacter aestuarii TaxID=2949426 RepID=A0ABQ5LNQ6_9RHOB|nr:alpha/beta hydrolase [Sinisalibacter aestuarii]GKY86639.1 hydrolase [Sinisalibacter aestuarii]
MNVLLIPGLLCDSFVWEPVLAQLDAAVADLSTQDSITEMAQDCLDAHPGKLRVAGHSMGARVAMEMAHLAPERIERLALLDTGIHPLKEGETAKRDEIVQFAYDNGMEALAVRWLPPMVHEPNQQNEALMRGLTDMVLRKDADLHARQIKALVNRPDAASYLSAITCPTLLVVGRQDQWSPVAQHEEMLTLLPNARLEVIENAGHFAPVEQPDEVAELLAGFLGA